MDRIRDSEFYEGFEGEGEIDLIYKKEGKEIKRLEIWYGYFSKLLNKMIQNEMEIEGLLYEHSIHAGWYEDEEPWEIMDVNQAITQFKNYKEKKLTENKREMSEIWPEIPKVLERILEFLEEAKENNGKVYIDYL